MSGTNAPKDFKPSKSTAKTFSKPRLYNDRNWGTYSRKFLRANPLCYVCGGKSEVVDHWEAHKGDAYKFWNSQNLMPMCKQDHDYVTGKFDRHVVPKTREKIEYIVSRRLESDITVRIKIISI